MKVLHITPHFGSGIGALILPWMERDPFNNIHTIISLDKNNESDWVKINEKCKYVTIHDDCYKRIDFDSFFKSAVSANDVVLMHWWNHPLLFDLMINYKWPPCRLFLYDHVSSLFPPYTLSENLVNFVDRLIFTSPVSYECKELKHWTDGQRAKLGDIWSGAVAHMSELEKIVKTPHDDFRIGYVGTADYGKLNSHFIKLCLKVNIQEAHFIVCSADSQQHLIDEVNKIGNGKDGVKAKFSFEGRVPSIIPYLAQFDVFGYPLHHRNFATCELALGEAMMAGCVPVVLNNPAERYIVKHLETGMVAGTMDDYPRHIEWLYHHPNEKLRMAENARDWAKQQYDIQRTMREWQDLFEKAMRKDKTSRSWNKEKNGNMRPAELYAESMGEYGAPFAEYLQTSDKNRKEAALKEIKKLFDTNPMFYSQNKGSVLQYLRFFPDDAVLREWAGCLGS